VPPVVDKDDDQKAAENGEDKRVERQTKPPEEEGKNGAGSELDQRVLPGDRRPAAPAAPAAGKAATAPAGKKK